MTLSDDPITLGVLAGGALIGSGGLSGALSGIVGGGKEKRKRGSRRERDRGGNTTSRRTGGTDEQNRIATDKARKRRRANASSLTAGVGVIS